MNPIPLTKNENISNQPTQFKKAKLKGNWTSKVESNFDKKINLLLSPYKQKKNKRGYSKVEDKNNKDVFIYNIKNKQIKQSQSNLRNDIGNQCSSSVDDSYIKPNLNNEKLVLKENYNKKHDLLEDNPILKNIYNFKKIDSEMSSKTHINGKKNKRTFSFCCF